MITSTLDIALMSKEQISSLTRLELIESCKLLHLRGYSRLNKAELARLVFKASNVERQAMIVVAKERQTLAEKSNLDKEYFRLLESNRTHPISKELIVNMRSKGNDPVIVANTLFQLCKNQYADITVAKECTDRLKTVLSELDIFSHDERELLFETWRKNVQSINYARKIYEDKLKESYAREPEKVIDTDKVIDWGVTNLTNQNKHYKGIALALLSGRRMIEIYGESSYSLGNIGIVIDGIAKKSSGQSKLCEFIPLCDRQSWITALNEIDPHRHKTDKQVNGTISKDISLKFPHELKELGIEKFKDCRDFYAGVCYATFTMVARDAMPFTKKVMGHDSSESTAYYRKYDCKPFKSLKDIFKNFTLL